MLDLFELPVEYKGEEILFPAELLPMGFTHKIKVIVEGTEILFEPDEEKNYRAMIPDTEMEKRDRRNKPLLAQICKTLDQLFGNGYQSAITIT